MKRALLAGVVIFAVGAGVGAVGTRSLAAAQQAPTRTMLLTVDLPEFQGKEARMWITDLAPGAATPKHSHPGHLLGYVMEGALVHQVDAPNRLPRQLKTGSAWEELPNEVHVGANASKTERARLIAFGIFDKGAPLSVPAP